MMQHTPFRPSRLAAALLVAGALAACSDAPTGAATDSDATLADQVAALGFRADMIEDHGDFVLVEGDIYLSKAQLRSVPVGSGDPMAPKFQYRTTNLVTAANVRDIVVDVSGLASQPGWQTAAREALAHWSGITNSNVQMVEGSPADIIVATTCTSYNVAAYASFPAGGNVGPTIYVNTCFGYSTSHAQKLHNMVHELGHSIGFRHSNYAQRGETGGVEGAVHIYGTPTSGNATGSVMNGGTALNSWAGFAASDLTAVRSIYPLPGPVMTVTNSGGFPLISWNALPGATSYSVYLVTYNADRTGYASTRTFSLVGTTTGTSWLDTWRSYTGQSQCTYPYAGEAEGSLGGHWYEYQVVAQYPNGTGSSFHFANVAEPNCGWD
jgi:hypothetical protein